MLEAITCLGQALLACVVIAALGVSQSRATTLRKLSLEELVAHSDTIVVGRCEKTETA